MKLTCFYHFIKTIVDWLRCRKKHYWEAFQMRDVKKKHLRALGELSGKKPMRCVFFALFPSIWKYDDVFKMMMSNPRFDPIILTCPIVNYGAKEMVEEINACANFFNGMEKVCRV